MKCSDSYDLDINTYIFQQISGHNSICFNYQKRGNSNKDNNIDNLMKIKQDRPNKIKEKIDFEFRKN